MRDRSPQPFFSISATWSSGSKSNLRRLADRANDGVEALVGPDRRAFVGNVGKRSISALERGFLVAQLRFEFGARRPLPSPAGRARPSPRARRP